MPEDKLIAAQIPMAREVAVKIRPVIEIPVLPEWQDVENVLSI
jgi:hypothetical protein